MAGIAHSLFCANLAQLPKSNQLAVLLGTFAELATWVSRSRAHKWEIHAGLATDSEIQDVA